MRIQGIFLKIVFSGRNLFITCPVADGMSNSTVWDAVWQQRGAVSDYSLQYASLLDGFAQKLGPRACVLEAGCGTGESLAVFQDATPFGLDFSKEACGLASGQQRSVIVCGDDRKMPFKDGSFDLVYNSGVLEHFPEHESAEMAREMLRVTKPGGCVMIILPNRFCLWYRVYRAVTKLLGMWEFGYERPYSVRTIRKLAQDGGLKVEKVFGVQAMVALATNNQEFVSLPTRKKLVKLDRWFPFKQYYAFGVGIICRK